MFINKIFYKFLDNNFSLIIVGGESKFLYGMYINVKNDVFFILRGIMIELINMFVILRNNIFLRIYYGFLMLIV